MDTSSLKEAGLTEGENKVYLALLELGSSTTGPIVEKSGVSRSIIYQILEKLMEKGLVSFITKEKTKYFQAAEPSKIIEYIEEREKNLKETKNKIEKILPELLLKKNTSKESKINVYTGMKGMITAHENMYNKLKSGDEYYYLGIPADQPEPHNLYWLRDHARREKLGIRAKLLFNKDMEEKTLRQRNSLKKCEARYMPTDTKTPACFLIYKDVCVIILQQPTPTSIEIINPEIAKSFKAYFDEFWKQAKPFKK
ncbi:MAG: TrmB family transcriptional regulator [Candidatus Nanoarchaeia archaeon]